MWRCKECGEEIKVTAIIKGRYPIFLGKDKKIIDNGDFDILYVPNSEIQRIYCECGKWCNTLGELENIAYWEEE